jgi:hypothetical protein
MGCRGRRTWPSTEAKSSALGHPMSRSSTRGLSIWACCTGPTRRADLWPTSAWRLGVRLAVAEATEAVTSPSERIAAKLRALHRAIIEHHAAAGIEEAPRIGYFLAMLGDCQSCHVRYRPSMEIVTDDPIREGAPVQDDPVRDCSRLCDIPW